MTTTPGRLTAVDTAQASEVPDQDGVPLTALPGDAALAAALRRVVPQADPGAVAVAAFNSSI